MVIECLSKATCSIITMADKIEDIVKCKYCYRYYPVSVHRVHIIDGCLVKQVHFKHAYQNGFRKPIQWDKLTSW